MSDCEELLGVAPDASLQDIKRAYARALKTNRPDDDPEAFARVHAAFEECVARFRRRQAGFDDEPDWFDDETAANDEAIPESPGSRAVAPVVASDVPSDLDSAEGARRAEVLQMVEAIFEAAGPMRAHDFYEWLRSDERLYELAFKREVGDLVIERMSERADSLRWRSMAAIHEFFEVDSIADPRLRHDYDARRVWLRVQADARFAQRLQAKRSPHADFVDRIVLAELFDPPNGIRRLKMHLIPSLPKQLRNRFNELSVEDPERAEAALSKQAREYWLPFTDPTRLHPRRLAIAAMQCALLTLPFALLVTASQLGWRPLLEVWGAIAGVISGIWLVFALTSLAFARYSAWRISTVGAGEAPAGSNILADRATAIGGGAALLSLAVAIVALRLEKVTTGLILQVWLTMFMVMAVFRGPRLRWEAVLCSLAVAVCAYPLIRHFGSVNLDDSFFAVGPGAFATGVLAVLLLDAMHARLTRQAPSDVRDAFSVPQCLLAIVAALVAWLA